MFARPDAMSTCTCGSPTRTVTRHLEFTTACAPPRRTGGAYSELKHRLAEREAEWDDINDYADAKGSSLIRGDPWRQHGRADLPLWRCADARPARVELVEPSRFGRGSL